MGDQYNIGSGRWPGLSKLIEECGEVQQVAGKIIGYGGINPHPIHWDGQDLNEALVNEMGDVLAAIRFVVEQNGLDVNAMMARSKEKLAIFERWHAEQQKRDGR